jgi:muramoyltetrapeptide carboxypeptidase
MDLVKDYDYPVCFNFPSGHINDNRAMPVGKIVQLLAELSEVQLISDIDPV